MMKPFLIDKLITLGFLSIGFIFGIIFLVFLNIPFITIGTAAIVIITFVVAWVVFSFHAMKRKQRHIQRIITEMEHPYLAGEVLPKPTTFTEQQYYEILQVISKDAIEQVEQANRDSVEYKEFVEQWIHEVKTPLTAMSLILANDSDLRKLRRELKRLDNLTDQVLHFARLQSIEKDRQFEHFSLAALLNHAVKNQMDVLIAACMQISIEGDSSVYSDQKALQFIVNQLLINSAKYSPGSQVKMSIHNNVLTVEDNGIGIPRHELPRIFERGYTGTNGRKLGTSTGMGLYIVANLCRELNISLQVDSEVGQFTRFTLTFPQI